MQILKKLSGKKIRYTVYSITVSLLLMWVDSLTSPGEVTVYQVLILLSATLLGAFFTQYTSITHYKDLLVLLLPFSLSLSAYLTLFHFPNFSDIFKLSGLVVFAVILYLVSLLNNIYLVVGEKEETIPLYRVAITWSQILLVVISIPLYSGFYKLDTGPVNQTLLAGFFTFLFTMYFFWNLSFDTRVRRISHLDIIINCFLSAFFVMAINMSISFIPTESFLRALFTASVLLFNLNYIDGYMKNKINIKLIYHYGLIFLISLFIVLAFRP